MADEQGCKIDRTADAYDLSGLLDGDELDGELLARWTGRDGYSASGYRSLTEWFNKRLLRTVYDEHGRETLGRRVDHEYSVLTGEDELAREELRESLRGDGIDVDGLLDAMPSWGTMRTHLIDCLDGEKEPSEGHDWERESVAMAASFAREKVEKAVTSLGTKGALDGTDTASVSIQVSLECDHCPTRAPLDVAIERGYVCETHCETTQDEELPERSA